MGTPKRRTTAAASSSGDLLAFPRPSLAVDVAVMSVVPAQWLAPDAEPDDRTLAVLLLRRTDGPGAGLWSLPGSFVRARERLADAVLRTLADKCGLDGLAPRQLHVFDEPGRDDRGWVVSVAHVDDCTGSSTSFRFSIDTTKYSLNAILKDVLARYDVVDMEIENPSLEEIIGSIYERPGQKKI